MVVCSRKQPSWQIHEDHVRRTIGMNSEYIRIDNRGNRYGLAAAYNEGVSKSSGEVIVFVHEDVFVLTENWGKILQDKFSENPALGLVGVAGTTALSKRAGSWASTGKQFIKGHVVHELKNKDGQILSLYSEHKMDSEVVAVDGLFFAVRRSLFDTISFDAKTFDHFHFYDLDICMQVIKTHKIIVTYDILVKHLSAGNYDHIWRKYSEKFRRKYEKDLPVVVL